MTFELFNRTFFIATDVLLAYIALIGTGLGVLYLVNRANKWSVIKDYVTTTHHRKIGVLYLLSATLFFLRAGIEALIIRTQLAVPENDFWVFQGDKFNEAFTTHGTIMIFFVAMPLLIGLMNVAVPLQIGAQDMAFPYMNALSFWLFLAGAILVNMSFFMTASPNAGWTAYAPLSTAEFTPEAGNDYYIFGLQVSGVGTILAAINMIVTIVRHRAPGMKMTRMPLFAWSTLVTAFLILIAFPVLTIALYILMFDRLFGTSFFSGEAGSPIYWQHLFWIFGHPEVYIIVIPAFGIFSDVISTFSKKRVFGYTSMVVAIVIIGLLGFMVWVHHMFTVGLGPVVNTVFAITTMLIAVPTGIKIFNWLFTMRKGVIHLGTPMLFAAGFIPTFVIGGVTGVMLAVAAADFQFHDTYFVVAHFHYTMVGGTVLGAFAGIYYWFPKMFGFKLKDGLGKAHFWLFLIGFHITFFPQHFAGLNGMPRRVYTYTAEDNIFIFNFISTIGAFMMGIGTLFFVWNIYKSFKNPDRCGNDPWNGRTLEWSVPSPAPEHPFDPMPQVTTIDPLWEAKRNRGGKLPVANTSRSAPIDVTSWQPVGFSGLIMLFSLSFIYHVTWLQIVLGIMVLAFFALRTLTDEHTKMAREGEDHDNI
ncbi:quinol oxidase subunit 1 [Pontibacillus chungwhensis BH030062]|uniref:Cytochrome c oxidase subunit 1 n=1 Tax=Pontibacillus chungwhensis BH030062 TaxID=1385513 RepID=A0A0A2VFU7_9BACI|nr:cytochrome c oxidase subunit I [Pontibacillus chungwhensis]KGP92510.1 quinol oxidase subunit 1 [Pontibacillus chungwhensis BH030062]